MHHPSQHAWPLIVVAAFLLTEIKPAYGSLLPHAIKKKLLPNR
jgi:hypothetical protein